MKTPMQEFIESITLQDSTDHIVLIPTISKAEIQQMIEKEKDVICQFADEFAIECINYHHEKIMSTERFYELTYGGNNE